MLIELVQRLAVQHGLGHGRSMGVLGGWGRGG